MTIEADQAAAALSTARAAVAARTVGSTEPPAIQIKMPSSDPGPRPQERARSQANSPAGVKQLLHDLMARLDENERRYGDALGGLNEKVDVFAGRTQAIGEEQAGDAGAAPGRLRPQAGSLAGFGDTSIAAREPSKSFDALSQQMDALMQRLDTALDASNETAALEKIESRLDTLTACFSDTREIHTKVDAIECHLRDFMGRAETSGASNHPAPVDDRLAAIEQTLSALNDSARNTDTRTVSALKAMYEVLHLLASQAGARAAAESKPDPQPRPDDSFDADSDFIAPARSTTGVAAAQIPSANGSSRAMGARHKFAGGNVGKSSPGSDKRDKRRPVLIAAAVLLLTISAGLLYSRLNSHPDVRPAADAPHGQNGPELPH